MRRVAAPLLFVLMFALGSSWLGCRQLAGIDDVELPVTLDARSPDGPSDGFAFESYYYLEGGYGCTCPGCTTLAEGLNVPDSLVLIGNDVYFLNYGPEDGLGSLMRVPIAGGTAQTVAANLTRPFSITADANNLYWQAEDGKGSGIVVKLGLSGGAPTTLASGLKTLSDVLVMSEVQFPLTSNVAVTATDVYFVAFSGGEQAGVLSVPVDGGTVSTLVSQYIPDGGAPTRISSNGIAIDGTALYGVTNGPTNGVYRVPLTGGPAILLADNTANAWTLTLSGKDIFFVDEGLNFNQATLQSIPQAGGTSKVLAKGLKSPWALVADGGSIFFVDQTGPEGGSVNAYDIESGAIRTLAPYLDSPVSLAVDSKNAYWTSSNCGIVAKVPR